MVVSLGAPCTAQEVDVPTTDVEVAPVTAPTGWVELIAPVQQRVDLKLYGFYIGELKAPSAQVDATIRVTKFLSITPSYLYYSIPASGLNELANVSRGFTNNLEEHQFRIDGTVGSRSVSLKSPSATCMSEGFFQPVRSTAIAIGSRSRIRSLKGPHREAFRVLRSLLRSGKRVDQKPGLGRRDGARRQACVLSAFLHVGRR